MGRKASAWMIACLVLAPSAASAQAGVLVRHDSGEVECSPDSPQAHAGAACEAVDCEPMRDCLDLPDFGARCVDPREEIVCVEGTGACDACPLNATTGADPEACLVIALPQGAYSLCIYDPRWVCLGEGTLEAARCLSAEGVSLGDCDGDGVSNGADGCVCTPGSDGGCPSGDAGTFDAGGRLDAGAHPADASSRDAAPPVELVFRGGGGCACATGVPAGERRATLGWLALALAVLARGRLTPIARRPPIRTCTGPRRPGRAPPAPERRAPSRGRP